MELEKKVLEIIKNPLQNIEIEVIKVVYETENRNNYLRIYINALDIETCVKATKVINPILDEADLIKESYTLEVLSKGEDNGN